MKHFIDIFLEVLKENSSKTAVSDEKSSFTYKELYDYSIIVAANLQS